MAQRRVEAVERALTLLEVFNEHQPELSLTELSLATGFYKSTILRLMASLEVFGFVVRNERGIYRIGPACARLAPLAGEGLRLEGVVRPVLIALRDISGETASFYIRDGDERVCLYRENGRHEVRHHLEQGARLPLDRGAAARVLCGGVSREVQVSKGEREPSLAAAAIGIFRPDGELLGALAVSGPRERLTDSLENHRQVLIEKAAELEACLPHGPVSF
ncbi:helix-turn-helix domain-containing protein [Halomonas alkaliantarctica]|uniref:Helix-turn-helix domain-containing protein n=1 Tax=Halomonas alkaliantarctica TaxID=232346 RepID=A0ABY8LMX3_9GAMM|nr:helix-turn-helix domain-containing protein [Halomonas alkaliantarctica]WGI25206.1 helix-turn-helix domain-containing protein [Halomonas alkaliantarctica]